MLNKILSFDTQLLLSESYTNILSRPETTLESQCILLQSIKDNEDKRCQDLQLENQLNKMMRKTKSKKMKDFLNEFQSLCQKY